MGENSPRLDHAKMFQDFIKGAVDDSNPIHFLKSNYLFFVVVVNPIGGLSGLRHHTINLGTRFQQILNQCVLKSVPSSEFKRGHGSGNTGAWTKPLEILTNHITS